MFADASELVSRTNSDVSDTPRHDRFTRTGFPHYPGRQVDDNASDAIAARSISPL